MITFGFSSNIDLTDPDNKGEATQIKNGQQISISGNSNINTNYSNWDKIDVFPFGDGQFIFDGNAQTQYNISIDSDLDGQFEPFSLLGLDIGNVRTNPVTIFVESEKGSTEEIQLNGLSDGGNSLTFDGRSEFSNITSVTITVVRHGRWTPLNGRQAATGRSLSAMSSCC